jgi:mRNA-degrading endonuclease HigB of HigAB toxin-antitoxin module
MIIDNFEQIKKLLTFKSEDEFYHLQILKRRKDCADHERSKNNNARCIKTYYIKNIDYLESKKDEIIKLCEMFNARAYINLNTKSFEKASLQLIKEVVDRVIFKQFEHVYRAYETVVGEANTNIGDKKWIIDIDTKDMKIVEETIRQINKCQSEQNSIWSGVYNNLVDVIPTVQGYHIITHPFNLKQIEPFKALYPFDIQKNNPTLLYFNKKELDKGEINIEDEN